MIEIPGHHRTPHLKDWMPAFQREVTKLYRAGLADLAEEAERLGHVRPMPRMPSLGEIARVVIARARAARFRNNLE